MNGLRRVHIDSDSDSNGDEMAAHSGDEEENPDQRKKRIELSDEEEEEEQDAMEQDEVESQMEEENAEVVIDEPLVDEEEDGEDEIVGEVDVVLVKPTAKLSRLLLPQGLRLDNAEKYCGKYKRKVGKLQMSVNVDCNNNSFDQDRVGMQTTYHFEGTRYSNKGSVNHVVGIFRNDKLYFVPVEHEFEMRRALAHSSNINAMGLDNEEMNKAANPIRIRFARTEDERQKKRREASSFHRTKVEEQDNWVPLEIFREDTVECERLVSMMVQQDRSENGNVDSAMEPSGECEVFKTMLMAAPRKKTDLKP